MTVRWKPLLILSGLFFLVAVVGVIAMAWTLVPRSATGVLKQARAAATAGRFEDAEIYYKQALQFESKNAATHEEFANLYRDWCKSAPVERRDALEAERTDHLVKAVKFDKSARGPRVQLLEEAIVHDNPADSLYWARELLRVDPENPDAHYVLAFEELETRSPNIPEVRRHLKVLEDKQASPIRLQLIRARLAQTTGDDKARDEAFSQARSIPLPADAAAIDKVARVRIEAIEIQTQKDGSRLDGQVKSFLAHVKELVAAPDLAAGRVSRLSQLMEQTQRALVPRSSRGGNGEGHGVDALVDAIEVELEGIFQKVLSGNEKSELQVYLSYADHLRFRQKRDRCLQVIEEALRQPAASRPASLISVMGLHAVAVEMTLSKQEDATRYDKSAPHIQALLSSSEPRFQGLGHLFQGAIYLEQSGLVPAVSRAGDKGEPIPTPQPKLRAMALNHLKQAAGQLPAVAEARRGTAWPWCSTRSRTWAASIFRMCSGWATSRPSINSGRPGPFCKPVIPRRLRRSWTRCSASSRRGPLLPRLKGTLHQISGELYQAERGPGDLERAAKEFEKAAASGQAGDSTVVLRQAQIEVQLGHPDEALARLERLRAAGVGGPGAENLAVLIYEEQGKADEARKRLREARSRFSQPPSLPGSRPPFTPRTASPPKPIGSSRSSSPAIPTT